ncbi:Os02g0124866 [Oryza sativa Japonica Group]|uniref:Os02g0124866 protein n=1 Tax=Oryza sativa subsp. japonica TaxID=39947 RepID=A0A0N7KEL5_ORYSJ|nr:hypothetical protein EE612_008579 [Oryza sativa]BAS76753.1 Os02g0124866 [Oryza sativa Japonica Group]
MHINSLQSDIHMLMIKCKSSYNPHRQHPKYFFNVCFYLCNTIVCTSQFPYPTSNDVLPVTTKEGELQQQEKCRGMRTLKRHKQNSVDLLSCQDNQPCGPNALSSCLLSDTLPKSYDR